MGWMWVGVVYFLDKVKGPFKWKYLHKGSCRMGGCSSVPLPRKKENQTF